VSNSVITFSSSLFRQFCKGLWPCYYELSVLLYFDKQCAHKSAKMPAFQFFFISTYWLYAPPFCILLSVLLYFDVWLGKHTTALHFFQFFFISTGKKLKCGELGRLSVLLYFDRNCSPSWRTWPSLSVLLYFDAPKPKPVISSQTFSSSLFRPCILPLLRPLNLLSVLLYFDKYAGIIKVV